MIRFVLPVLVTLNVCGALVLPTFWVAKLKLAGMKEAAGPGATELPVRVIV